MEKDGAGAKKELRARLLEEQSRWEPEMLRRSDRRLFERLRALPEYRRAGRVFLFAGTGPEPDTGRLIGELLAEGRKVAVPLCLPPGRMEAVAIESPEQLKPGRYGIPEPGKGLPRVSAEALDLVIVPAVCYDREGYRLGRGGGYYDRYLARPGGAFSVGLCRSELLQARVPREAHDRRVRVVITEGETIRTD